VQKTGGLFFDDMSHRQKIVGIVKVLGRNRQFSSEEIFDEKGNFE